MSACRSSVVGAVKASADVIACTLRRPFRGRDAGSLEADSLVGAVAVRLRGRGAAAAQEQSVDDLRVAIGIHEADRALEDQGTVAARDDRR
jgi:hypothetical protein